MRRFASALNALLMSALLFGACGGGDRTAAPTTTQPPATVESVLAEATAAMAAVTTLRFTLAHEGADVFIEGGGQKVAFERAEGRFAAPSSADAIIRVSAGSLTTDVGAVAIDGQVWLTDPVTGRWAPAPDAFRFDPARIFRADVGLSAMLKNGLTHAVLTSPTPDRDGRYHITAQVSAEQVATLTSGLVRDVEDAEFWIDAATSLLTQTRFAVPLRRGEARWTMKLSGYGSPVKVTQPETS